MQTTTTESSSKLFPVFLKPGRLHVLVVGAGNTGLEQLQVILQHAPATAVTVVAAHIRPEAKQFAAGHPHILLIEKTFDPDDLADKDLVIIAINDKDSSNHIRVLCKQQRILVNVANTPEQSDFHLGINGSSSGKVNNLNGIAPTLPVKKDADNISAEKRWRKIASYCLFAFFFMIVGHVVLSYIPFDRLWTSIKELPQHIDNKFYWMIAAGFLAQLIDGALGMGYGVTCTTILLSLGINLPAISGSIHTAEMFSSGASGYSHYKFGNVNKKLFKTLLIPGIIGAVAGAFLLSKLGDKYANYIRPVLAAYTLLLGARIVYNAFRKNPKAKKVKHVGWLGAAGGFLDSFGGGGWGPLVTSTLISKGRTPKYVIGSVSISEFFVTLASALTFFSMIGISHWQVIVGLIIGGVIASPIAARLAGRLPLKTMFIAVGSLVIIWSLRILVKLFI